ncbi:hypothetical protein BGZ93_001460 [Podila epicladia]|nr:hypothetical protein BGZ92_008696 [Podila epicladia]KAG0097989.1 hypothetical protein BGZ93_001460 [Podila epicladia]
MPAVITTTDRLTSAVPAVITTTYSLTTTTSASASLSSPTITPTPDPCSVATSAQSPIAYDVVKACLDADFPFPADNHVKTAESIKKLISNSFVFEDLAKEPPSVAGLTLKAAPIADDIDELLAMRANAVQTHREFHEAITDIMIKARDAHLSYSADCFLQFSFDHGFTLADLTANTGSKALNVVAELPSFSNLSSLPFSPSGCTVVTINSQPAIQFVQTWADNNIDMSKDAAVRYNVAIGGPIFDPQVAGYSNTGQFSHRSRLPAEASLTFGFTCPHLWGADIVKQVVVGWGATYEGSQLNVTQYYNTYCVANPLTSTAVVNQDMELGSSEEQDQYDQQQEQPQVPFDRLPESMQEHEIDKTVEEFKAMPAWLAKRTQEVILGPAAVDESKVEWTDETDEEILRDQAERMLREMPEFEPVPKIPIFERPRIRRTIFDDRFTASAEGYQVLKESPLDVHAVLLADNKTGVILIPTFLPPGGSTVLAQFYANLIEAISVLRPVAEKLILDLSRNGGGSTCLSRRTLELFFPETPQAVTNFRYSDLEALYIQTGFTSAGDFNRATNGTKADSTYLTTTVSHPNRKFSFTNYFSETCASFNYSKLPVNATEEGLRPRAIKKGYVYDPKAVYHPWDAEDIIIFNEGTCGSACATFANQLHQKNNVKAVVVASGPNTDKTTFSTFPGGQVLKGEDYFEIYRKLKKALNIQGLPDSSDVDAMQDEDAATSQQEEQYPLLDKGQVDILLHAQGTVSFTEDQGKQILRLLPEPLQHSANLTVTWRQTYNTGNAQILFTANSTNQGIPNWPLASWTDYSFIPADFRITLTRDSYNSYHHMWEEARDAVWP